ncbi:phytoene desaturase family protein [Candidatus Poriferisodalis sp.]|uniref:phytoene desaturase family protein n=1 Tax=Candidatus Poriferisodalis sp. TaxID=3101277 RepID=UPI003B52D573
MTSAIVVGSGPNGLAAAVHLARAGVEVTVLEAAPEIGGGVRSAEMIVPGLVHDQCSAVHPIAAASPFLRSLDLARLGLRWRAPIVDCAHPLDDGSAGLLYQSIDDTAAGLDGDAAHRTAGRSGASCARKAGRLSGDGARWHRLFTSLTSDFDRLFADISRPLLEVPRAPVLTARFGMAALTPAAVVGRLWRGEAARALWAGVAAHTFWRLDHPMTSAVGLMILAAGHTHGWVVAEGGSQAIADALAADLAAHGGRTETGVRVGSAAELPPADLLLLDVSPSAAADILGKRLPPRVARAYRRYRHGPGAFKVDFAIEGDVPWRAPGVADAGTVHLGGDAAEVMAGELATHRGHMPERPFVLVGQQYRADPGRSVGNIHPLWTYAHVPHGYDGDATEAIIAQIERFAPGFRDQVVGMAVRSTTEMSVYNPNYIGGDILSGESSPLQLLFRPRVARDPYFTGVPGTYLCSASTPPGAGAHGLCGANAATRALAAYNPPSRRPAEP